MMESEREQLLTILARYYRLRLTVTDKQIHETLNQLINETMQRLREISEAESSGAG